MKLSKIEKDHWEHTENQLREWGFKEDEDSFVKSHDFYWSRPDDDSDEIMYSSFLWFDKQGKFFTNELTNEHGHYADNPLIHVKCVADVIDFWKSTTGEILKVGAKKKKVHPNH